MATGWTTIIGTLLGGVLGLGAGTLNDRIRWRRDREAADRSSRLAVYAEYQSAVAQVCVSLREVVRMLGTAAPKRARLARSAFAVSGFYEVHYRLRLLASPEVAAEAVLLLDAMHAIRNALENGALRPDAWVGSCRDMNNAAPPVVS